jgi:transposase
MGQSRRGEREAGKSDQIDARAVARAVLKEGVERFAVAYLDEAALEIRLLSDHREDLIAERTRVQNRLRWHLLDLAPELEASLPAGGLDRCVQLDRVVRVLRRMPRTARVKVSLKLVAQIRALTRQAKTLQRELDALVARACPQLVTEQGCGTLTAATIIGRVAGAERFATDSRFARQAGTAPIPASSGRRDRHRYHRGGDRKLNRALQTIAVTRARIDPETKAYLARKRSEGKSNREAVRALKRHLARRIWRLLQPAETLDNPVVSIHCSAPRDSFALT